MKELMDRTREKYDKKRNKFSFIDKLFFNRLSKPAWVRAKGDTRFDVLYRDQDILYSRGKIVLAHVFKANTSLYQYGEYDSPATVVYSEDPFFEEDFYKLMEIVGYLSNLKNNPASEHSNLARMLADDMTAHYNILLPNSITYGKKVYYTSLMVHRKLLPSRYLKSNWFPLLICPSETKASSIVPFYCWDRKLALMWEMKELPKQKFVETDQI